MKLRVTNRGIFLEGITKDNVRFSNLAGRDTGSQFYNPEKPSHEITIWIEDPDILQAFRDMNVTISEKINQQTREIEGYSVRFKAYVKMKQNRRNGKMELSPRVIIKSDDPNDTGVRLEKEAFNLVDSAKIKELIFVFHLYKYNENKPDCIPALDGVWCITDPDAGIIDYSYIDERIGYAEEDAAPDEYDEEEVPFR